MSNQVVKYSFFLLLPSTNVIFISIFHLTKLLDVLSVPRLQFLKPLQNNDDTNFAIFI